MTREEAIKNIKEHCYFANLIPQAKEALDIAIKALEQEPCEDAISRQAEMNCFKKWQPYMATRLFDFEKELSSLPPVTSQPKSGHWNTYVLSHRGIDEEWLECSECMWSNALLIPRNYCPNCGARMHKGG